MIISYGSYSVTLPSPVYGDETSVSINTNTNTNRQGANILYRSSDWLKTKTVQYLFETLTGDTVDDLIELLDASAGQLVSVTDHLSSYSGYIVTDGHEIITLKDDCSYDVRINIMRLLT